MPRSNPSFVGLITLATPLDLVNPLGLVDAICNSSGSVILGSVRYISCSGFSSTRRIALISKFQSAVNSRLENLIALEPNLAAH